MKRVQQLALVSVAASGALSWMNLWAGLQGRSTSTTAAGVEFAGDVLASLIVFLGAYWAARPADA